MVLPQSGMVILLNKKHAFLLLYNVPLLLFLFITAEERQYFTYSNNNIQSFSVFLKQRHFEGKYITISHCYICHDTQICDRSDGICASFRLVGKEGTKSNLGLTSLLGIDTFCSSSCKQSWSLREKCAHTYIEVLLLRVGRSQSKASVCLIINDSNSNQLITQNQLIKL